MSEDTALTPTTLRTLSVPGTPGAGPAAPLKQQFRAARSHPPATALKQLAAEVPEPTEPLNLSSAFDAVATNIDACLDTASSVASTFTAGTCLSVPSCVCASAFVLMMRYVSHVQTSYVSCVALAVHNSINHSRN